MEQEALIRETYTLAEAGVRSGNHPFGALIENNGKVLVSAHNTVCTDNDCTCHAEVNVVRKSEQLFDSRIIKGSTLYASTEPCAMCAGAIYWAGIKKVVFGCSAPRLREVAGTSLSIRAADVYQGAKEPVELIGPVLEEEGAAIHQKFWSR